MKRLESPPDRQAAKAGGDELQGGSSAEIREVLRLWLRGEGQRCVARHAALDRKTVRRYVEASPACGLDRNGREGQLTDQMIAQVCERVRPHRVDGHGGAWATLKANHDQLKTWPVDNDLTVVKAHDLLVRRGIVVPQRTLHRYALEILGVGRSARATTVRVADGDPGQELRVMVTEDGNFRDSYLLRSTPRRLLASPPATFSNDVLLTLVSEHLDAIVAALAELTSWSCGPTSSWLTRTPNAKAYSGTGSTIGLAPNRAIATWVGSRRCR